MNLSDDNEAGNPILTEQDCQMQVNRSASPGPSCASIDSQKSLELPMNFKDGDPSSQHSQMQVNRSASPGPSCVSMNSQMSLELPMNFKDGDPTSQHSQMQVNRSASPGPSCVSMNSQMSLELPMNFKDGDPTSQHSSILAKRLDLPTPSVIITSPDSPEVLQEALKDGDHPSGPRYRTELQKNLKLNLIQKFQSLHEAISNQGNRVLLNKIFTELYITEGESGEINKEHEVRQIEAASRRTVTEDTPIKCNNIFTPLSKQDKPIRTVLTKGFAGIGKSVSVQKFILDWAEGKANQDIHFIFPLPFRELNLMKGKKLSLINLLRICSKDTKEINISSLHKTLFICDGLDECRFPLDFQSSVSLCDITQLSSVDVLVTNLIRRNLLPSALIWITTRPAAADQIPSEYIDRVTEVRGFRDPQKEEYFRKRISDPILANSIITHLKLSRSLYIMCHIPVFCWISATVLKKILGGSVSENTPKTLTQMYTQYLIIETNMREKHPERKEELILKLGKLAFQQLMKGNMVFYEEDLKECGIDVREASVHSGVCTQILREEFGLHQSKVFCFVHLTIQEHLAALYVHLTFINNNTNVLHQSLITRLGGLMRKITLSDVHKSAVDQGQQSKNGHLNLFLRFLLGLSLENNQALLQGLVTQTRMIPDNKEEIVQYIKKKIRKNPSPLKSINLFHCLNELGDQSLVEEVQKYLQFGKLPEGKLSTLQWSAVVFLLSTSEQEQDVFHLNKYISPLYNKPLDDVLLKLLSVAEASRTAQLSNCNLTEKSCAALASVLSSRSCCLNTIDLSGNKIGSSGVKLLSDGLESPHCTLERLKLKQCDVTNDGYNALASVLKSNPSHLRELDLSKNYLGDQGMRLLSYGLESPHCKLEILRLTLCDIRHEGCAALASALKSSLSYLRELDLSVNKLGDSGVKLLFTALDQSKSKLNKIWLFDCDVTDEGCAALASALRSNPSHLRSLDLSNNKLGDSGVKMLSGAMGNLYCNLETLWLCHCDVTEEGCAALATALRSNPSHLRNLYLTANKLGDSGVKVLAADLGGPDCKLEILRLKHCDVTDEGCAALASALTTNPSHLRKLDLNGNKLRNSGVKLLAAGLKNPHCNLTSLWLKNCDITDEGCAALASALRSNPSHLKKLDLSINKLQDSGVKLLSAELENPNCRLESLWLCNCDVTDEGCAALATALTSEPSHLKQLDLSRNKLKDSGVKLLSAGLQKAQCKLETLRLKCCDVTEEGCAALASALSLNPSHLRKLDLTANSLGDSGVKLLRDELENPQYKLKILQL